jgi:hypothetical protein
LNDVSQNKPIECLMGLFLNGLEWELYRRVERVGVSPIHGRRSWSLCHATQMPSTLAVILGTKAHCTLEPRALG